MSNILLLFIISQLSFAYSGSWGRYGFQNLKSLASERHRRMHKTENCMFGMCEDSPNYPTKDVENLVNKHKSLHSYFGESVIEPSEGLSVFTREDYSATPFCETRDVTVVPKVMEDIYGVQRNIVNTAKHTQLLKFQMCSTGKSCYPKELTENLSFSTHCVQKFNVIKLITVNVTSEKLEYGKFQIPSTCVCNYELESYL